MILINRLSIQSKLILMFLGVSIGSILVISALGYANSKSALTTSIYNQLTGIRVSKANLVQSQLTGLRNQVITLAENGSVLNAMRDFRASWKELDDKVVERAMDDKIRSFYETVFLPKLAANIEGEVVLETYLPHLIPSRYLQYFYVAKNPNPYEFGQKLQAADDGSSFSAAHKKYHPFFARAAKRFQVEDLMLVDPESLNILYTYQKTAEFATSLENGPFADTNLGMLLRSVRRSMDRGDYKFADFEHYRPNLGRPSAFLASPIFDDTKMIGILVVQFPIDEVNRVMTGNFKWETEGLGKTGEVFLVGPDFRMRSRSRFMQQDEKNLIATLERLGVPSRTMKRIRNMHTLVLNLENRSPNVEAALGGETGIALTSNYRGVPVISSHAPLEVEGLRWGIVAEMDQQEAFAPIRDYEKKVLAYSVGIILLVALLASILARFFVSPIHKLAKGARRIAAGESDVVVKVKSRDEFRDLADSFNEMSRSLKAKGETIEKQIKENEELLLNILPGPVAAKMRHGEESLTESFADVTVLFAEVSGYTELSEGMSADQSVSLLNDLIIAFDEAADRHGVEKVKTTGTSYMAVCGLSVSRPDHVNRVIEFAQDIMRIVRRFNEERNTNLTLEIGVNAGPVVGGVVGRSKFIYDLWGDTVNVARGLRAVGRVNVIEVTQAVHDRLADLYDFESSGTVHVRGKGELATWSIKP